MPTGPERKKGADSMSPTKRQRSSGTRGGLQEPGGAHGKRQRNPGDLQRRRSAASGAAEARPGYGDAGQCRLPAGKASGRGGRAGECPGQKSRTSPRGGRKLLGSWERGNAVAGGGGRGSARGAWAKGSAPQVPRLRPLARSWDMGQARRRWQNSRRAAASRAGSPRPACAGRRPRGRDGVRLPGLCRREAGGMPCSRANTVEAARETGGHRGTSGGPGAMT